MNSSEATGASEPSDPSAVLYGIPNCDTVAKARRELTDRGVAYRFANLARGEASRATVQRWVQVAGAERVINRRGTTWRSLSQELREQADRADQVADLILAKPSIVKRPVVEWPDGRLTIGFKAGEFLEVTP